MALQGGRIVIVGAGVVGLSIAHHLGVSGYDEVVVLERGLPGEGATAYATGGIRRQFSARVNVELVQRSMPVWENFREITGAPMPLRRHGYLFLLSDERAVRPFEQAMVMQRSLGVDVQMLAPDDVLAVFPGVRTDDLLAGFYSPSDGSASPADAVFGFAASARAHGIDIRKRTEFLGIRRGSDGAITHAVTSDGALEAEAVVLAPGPWARAAGQLCGVELAVSSHPRQAFATAPLPQLNGTLPLTVDLASGAYLHPEPVGTAVVGGTDRDTPQTDVAALDWSRVDALAMALTNRFPFLQDMRVTRGWCGLREMTPDDLGIVGPLPTVAGLWVAAGFSGHGFMQAPAIGAALTQWLVSGSSDLDLGPLCPQRFERVAEVDDTVERAIF